MRDENRSIKLQCLSALTCYLLIAGVLFPVSAEAKISIDQNSKIALLYGYSLDLAKQEPTPVHPLLSSLLPPFQADLQSAFGAEVDYLYDGALTWQIEMEGLPKGDPVSIKAVFKRQNYTHLVVTNIIMIDSQRGLLSLQVASLSTNGAQLERSEPTPGVPMSISMSPPELDVVRQNILSLLASKLRGENETKRVHIDCIVPRDLVIDKLTDELELEQLLAERVTRALVHLYHGDKMRKRGYVAAADDSSYKFSVTGKEIRCSTTFGAVLPISITATLFDYKITGSVGVGPAASGYDSVDLQIEVFQRRHDPARIGILELFERSKYYEKQNFSIDFSERTLPNRFECEWMKSLEN